MNATKTICKTRWFYNYDGTVTLSFHNCLTDVCVYKPYKTVAAAKAAETKFINRMNRVYTEQRIAGILKSPAEQE